MTKLKNRFFSWLFGRKDLRRLHHRRLKIRSFRIAATDDSIWCVPGERLCDDTFSTALTSKYVHACSCLQEHVLKKKVKHFAISLRLQRGQYSWFNSWSEVRTKPLHRLPGKPKRALIPLRTCGSELAAYNKCTECEAKYSVFVLASSLSPRHLLS